MLSPLVALIVVLLYFGALILISYLTSKDEVSNTSFFQANKSAPWYLVAFGMIGASISGVTFISIPGWVSTNQFSYMQTVLGYLAGYAVIALVLMPMYYKLNLVSIYSYLEQRFGTNAYKTGSAFFLLSRTTGSSFRLFLMAIVVQKFIVLDVIPFWATVAVIILLIWIYTHRGGIKTIIWTDTLQTFFLILSLIMTIYLIGSKMEFSLGTMVSSVFDSDYSQIFYFESGWSDPKNFFKQFFAGAFICITMSGLDQDIMQKNLACKNIGEAQKNMFWFSILLVLVNFLFLMLGALLYIYAAEFSIEIPSKIVAGIEKPNTDLLFPTIALGHLSQIVGIFFLLGIIASTYASSDSALASLTTAFCVDFLNFKKLENEGKNTVKIRNYVHLGFSFLLFLVILIFWKINDDAVIESLFKTAGFTYGPLLGLFAFGFYTKWKINDKWVLPICLLSPILTYILNMYSEQILFGYKFSFELIIINGLLTFLGLFLIRKKNG